MKPMSCSVVISIEIKILFSMATSLHMQLLFLLSTDILFTITTIGGSHISTILHFISEFGMYCTRVNSLCIAIHCPAQVIINK